MILRIEQEQREANSLISGACLSSSFERKDVRKHPYRTEFQRDRDRIIHSKAFRRLEYKTQVFLTKKGDHLRTRLTHSLEVAQISRTIATLLGLNVDLVEAIALGHDLGHTPFGHAGERKLIEMLESEGIYTFKHNVQSVKIIDLLEKKYLYDGLRLTLPVREGIFKHTKLPTEIPYYCRDLFPENPFSVTLEGQVVAQVDEIAQMTHDMDDYLRYNILDLEQLTAHEIFDWIDSYYIKNYEFSYYEHIRCFHDDGRKKDTVIRCIVDFLVSKLVEHSEQAIINSCKLKPLEIDDEIITFNEPLKSVVKQFHEQLNKKILSDYKIIEMDKRGELMVATLFNYYRDDVRRLPSPTYEKYNLERIENPLIVIADYISGMTDRYAMQEYQKIVDVGE
jgi:dGTPase